MNYVIILIDIDNILQPTYLKHRENSGALILTFGLKMEGVWPDIMQTIFVTCACIGNLHTSALPPTCMIIISICDLFHLCKLRPIDL